MVSNIHVDSRRGRLLTIDEVEQVQRQSIAGLIGHIFQLTYASMVDRANFEVLSLQIILI